MSWLQRLATEISSAQGNDITEDQLLQKFNAFISGCQDPYLRASYPEDLHHAKRAKKPQASTRDIILSFMDRNYPALSVPFLEEIAEPLNAAAARRDGELAKVLAKERLRRFTKRAPPSYWELNQERIAKKYSGVYALLRIDSASRLQAEAFSFSILQHEPMVVSVYWFCNERMLVGDLLVNTYRFSGLMVQRSTDAVIEPGCISILRAARATLISGKGPLVIGGFILGWKDDEPTALFQSRIALIQLDIGGIDINGLADFERVIAAPSTTQCLNALRTHRSVVDCLVPQFLRQPKLEMGQLDARNSLPNLDNDLITVDLTL